jgi:DNA-binding transcriptional ArsR family regulator
MAVDQENVSRILSVLSHPLRREILLNLSKKEECSFMDLANILNVDTGKLSFHIRNLAAFIERTTAGKYRLSKVGENAVALIRNLEAWSVEVDVAGKTAVLQIPDMRRRATAFLVDFGLLFGVFLALPGVLLLLTSGGPFFQYVNVILFLILLWVYLTLLEGFAGQSLGERAMGLRVVTVDGKKLSYDHAAVRNFGKVFLLPLDLYLGFRLHDKRFPRYFEKFSGTTMIDLRPRSAENAPIENRVQDSS